MAEIALFVALYAMNGLSVSAPARLLFLRICHGYWESILLSGWEMSEEKYARGQKKRMVINV
jgi:hypothetical protein